MRHGMDCFGSLSAAFSSTALVLSSIFFFDAFAAGSVASGLVLRGRSLKKEKKFFW
jgi:hypothetical protein